MDTDLQSLKENNLANIKVQTDLFGGEHKQLGTMDRVGFAPISVWRPNWSKVFTLKKIVGDWGQARTLVKGSGTSFRTMDSGKKDVRGASIFNPHLAQMIYSAYCPKRARVYDAFAGGGTRGFIGAAMGHSYLGVEIRPDEVGRIKQRQKELGVDFEIVCADSSKYQIEENSFDFGLTCPPYYDLEVYSEMDGDMSNAGSYEDFLSLLRASADITFRGLKSGSLFAIVVGNFRDKKGSLRHFNGDVVRMARDIGFTLHDEIIFWGATDAAYLRLGNFVANRKSVRVHEYILVFKKP